MATIYEMYNITIPEDPVLRILYHEEDTLLSLYLKLTSIQYLLRLYVLLYNSLMLYIASIVVTKYGFRNMQNLHITYFQCMLMVAGYYIVKPLLL
jgi:hypothetical protein